MKTTITEIRKISGFGVNSGEVRETDFNAQICATSNLSDEELIKLMKAAPELLEACKSALSFMDSKWPDMDFGIPQDLRDAITKATHP